MSEELIAQLVQKVAELEQRLDNQPQPENGYNFQPVSATVKGWWPANNQASQTLDLQDGTWGLPAGIKAVSVYLGYTAANNGDYGLLEKSNADGEAVNAKCPDANESGQGSGIVICDANGDIYFRTNNATNTVYLAIHGYFT